MSTQEKQLDSRATVALLLSAILPLLDSSLVNVLLPTIGADFKATQDQLQWGISGYIFAAAVGIILSTTCLRRYGSWRVWVISVGAFAIFSALVGLSNGVTIFVLMRVCQGIACGFIMPAVQAIVVQMVGKENMRSALATIGLPAVIAPAFGPLCGGILVDLIGWRWLFLINLPLALVALMVGWSAFPREKGQRVSLGLGQAFLASVGMLGILWAVGIVANEPMKALIIVGVSVLVIALFTVVDLRSSTPLLDMSLYGRIPFAVAMLLCLIVGMVFYGTLLSTSLHVQSGLDQAAWVAGVILGIQGAGAWVARSLVKGIWKEVDAFGIIAVGLVTSAIGTVLIQSISQWNPQSIAVLTVASLVRGLGLGACTLVCLSAAYEVVHDSQVAAVGAHTRLMLQMGGAWGTALVGAWQASALLLGWAVVAVSAVGALAAIGQLLYRHHSGS